MVRDVKTLEIPWWLQLSKRQILTFLPRLTFGTVRSDLRGIVVSMIGSACHRWAKIGRGGVNETLTPPQNHGQIVSGSLPEPPQVPAPLQSVFKYGS
jgi:hypothetical protein